jgi:hypothetical protein
MAEGRAMRTRSLHMSLSIPCLQLVKYFKIDSDSLNMATFAPIPYKYVPTALRPRGAKVRRKPIPEQSCILNIHRAKQLELTSLEDPIQNLRRQADPGPFRLIPFKRLPGFRQKRGSKFPYAFYF